MCVVYVCLGGWGCARLEGVHTVCVGGVCTYVVCLHVCRGVCTCVVCVVYVCMCVGVCTVCVCVCTPYVCVVCVSCVRHLFHQSQ